MTSAQLNLSLVPENLIKQALDAWEKRNISGLMLTMDNQLCLRFVLDNVHLLMKESLFEVALLDAYTSCRGNWHNFSTYMIRFLFSQADRKRLLSAGSPLPGDGPFVVYRGVAGIGSKRRVRGISWTADYDKAVSFAARYKKENPSVFEATVPIHYVYAYCNKRNEQEFFCNIPSEMKLKKYNIGT